MDDEPATPQSSRIRPQRVVPVAAQPRLAPERTGWTSFTDAIPEADEEAVESDEAAEEAEESDDTPDIEAPPDDDEATP
jgi:hypothetical protein